MADSANFALNLQNVPSIFEITAAEFLDNLLYPAFGKIFDFFGLNFHINIKGVFIQENLSPIVTALLQFFYLRKRGGSFGESFYGLQRVNALDGKTINTRQQVSSAAVLVLLPLIENKLKERSTHHESTNIEEWILKGFHVYKVVKTVNLFFYLTKHTLTHSPIFKFLGLNIRYPMETAKEDKSTMYILRSLEVLAFFLQFLQWWYVNKEGKSIGGLKTPPPKEFQSQTVKMGTCPVCIQKIENPTACAISGYVFCWKCISNHIKERRTCPVTNIPITLEDLVRIYDV